MLHTYMYSSQYSVTHWTQTKELASVSVFFFVVYSDLKHLKYPGKKIINTYCIPSFKIIFCLQPCIVFHCFATWHVTFLSVLSLTYKHIDVSNVTFLFSLKIVPRLILLQGVFFFLYRYFKFVKVPHECKHKPSRFLLSLVEQKLSTLL